MVSRSLIAGLMSVGVNIQNLQANALPISRTLVAKLNVVGGIHVRIHPDRPDFLLIEFLDEKGINVSKAREKKIEGAYFKEDLRRVGMQEIGSMSYPADILDNYRKTFETQLNVEAIRNSSSKIVIDYAYGVSGAILPELLAKFGCDAVVLNASLRQNALSMQERELLIHQLGHVVEALKANLGYRFRPTGNN